MNSFSRSSLNRDAGGREPCPLHRSVVPDLLFEDVQATRIEDIRPFLGEPELIETRTPLHRVTIFLTYGCNLACPYCKTIARSAAELRVFPQKAATFTYAFAFRFQA